MFEKRVSDMKALYIDKVLATKAILIRNVILGNMNTVKSILEKLDQRIIDSQINWKKVLIEDYFDISDF